MFNTSQVLRFTFALEPAFYSDSVSKTYNLKNYSFIVTFSQKNHYLNQSSINDGFITIEKQKLNFNY